MGPPEGTPTRIVTGASQADARISQTRSIMAANIRLTIAPSHPHINRVELVSLSTRPTSNQDSAARPIDLFCRVLSMHTLADRQRSRWLHWLLGSWLFVAALGL